MLQGGALRLEHRAEVSVSFGYGEGRKITLQLWQWQREVRASSGEEIFTSYLIARQ